VPGAQRLRISGINIYKINKGKKAAVFSRTGLRETYKVSIMLQ
jgi:hypothetical protein